MRMRNLRHAVLLQSSCSGFEIPTWQRQWSVLPTLTWNGFKSPASARNPHERSPACPSDRCGSNPRAYPVVRTAL
ncbi:hypothetical protein IRJ41_007169 [Triplophysa rosa]|uniref:Uncharacterized protein n=1 Tax=Triplophysa rosa TaxID=992332 RepID=A0A9W8C6T0_TRIRA|nr:hypothetical protein IRJ41_007169 [Triplophysa rosa]